MLCRCRDYYLYHGSMCFTWLTPKSIKHSGRDLQLPVIGTIWHLATAVLDVVVLILAFSGLREMTSHSPVGSRSL
ncbi:hypothetical protein K474DRAFT_1190795 [Panus rudis PR-1116 ss-1]|nr:hypothetical protein K474DRAFT_1190795 [Panus rudis PR-1116 ss-1]